MATSGSYDYTSTRNQLLEPALRKCGMLAEGETASAQMINDAARDLERMVKAWQAKGIHIWKEVQCVLFLELTKEVYSLGSTGDNFVIVDDLVTTTLSTAASENDTTIEVSSATGIADGYNIGIVMDDNTIHWTTVNGALSGTTVTLTTGIDDDTAAGNAVYVYQNKAPRPLKIPHGMLEIQSTSEIELQSIGSEDYFRLGNKSAAGVPVQYYYKPLFTNGKFYLWPTVENETYFANLTCYIPIQDFDSAGNNADFPIEWEEAIIWNLARRLYPEYGVTDPITIAEIKEMAAESLKEVNDFDEDEADVVMMPDFV